MILEDFIIKTYCFVDDYLQENQFLHLRKRGEKPALTDFEVITMEIVGEFLSHNSGKAIWTYFKEHWFHFFPKIGCRTSFTRQCANLNGVKKHLQTYLSETLSVDQDLFLCDGFPIPICHIKRYKHSTNTLSGEGSVGYCAAKDDKYFGFKGHILITQHGVIVAL